MNRCGTEQGYQAHYKAGTDYCDPCRAAHTEYRATQRAERELTATHARRLAGQRAYAAALRRLRDDFPTQWNRLRYQTGVRAPRLCGPAGMGPTRVRRAARARPPGRGPDRGLPVKEEPSVTPTERLNAAIARAEAATEGPWRDGNPPGPHHPVGGRMTTRDQPRNAEDDQAGAEDYAEDQAAIEGRTYAERAR